MHDEHRSQGGENEFSSTEGLALALNYLADPADVACPTCGPETIEVVAYLDAGGIANGVVRASSPEGEYTVVLYCHQCKRAAALDLSPDSLPDDFRGDVDGQDQDAGRDTEHGNEGGTDRWAA